MTSNCGENKEVAHEPQASVSLMFSPRFDFFCHALLTSLMATWDLLFVCLFVFFFNEERRKATCACILALYHLTVRGSICTSRENIFKTACFDDALWLILYRILPV